jgi:hypothetical protein
VFARGTVWAGGRERRELMTTRLPSLLIAGIAVLACVEVSASGPTREYAGRGADQRVRKHEK